MSKRLTEAHFLIEAGIMGLIPYSALKDLCSDEKEFEKYAILREDILIDLAGLMSLWMGEHYPQNFPPGDKDIEKAMIALRRDKDAVEEGLVENLDTMLALVKDPKRYKRYQDAYEARKNEA